MGYEWIGATAIGIASIWGTVWSGSQQRKSQHKISREQDWSKGSLELEKEKRLAYSKLLGKLDRAVTFATADKTVRKSLMETIRDKSADIERAFEELLTKNIPPGTPVQLAEEAAEKMRKDMGNIISQATEAATEERRAQLLKDIGYGSVDISAHIAIEELFSGAAEVSFLSEGLLAEPARQANIALMSYLIVEPLEIEKSDSRLREFQDCAETLRVRMQADLNTVSHRRI